MESLSAYARQFLQQMRKPDIDDIEGLPPTIAIEQRSGGANPRSTVATTTEIYDYLRLLFARCGQPTCWHVDEPTPRRPADLGGHDAIAFGIAPQREWSFGGEAATPNVRFEVNSAEVAVADFLLRAADGDEPPGSAKDDESGE